VIPVDEGRPEALEAAGLVVAEEEERKKEKTKKNRNEKPTRSGLKKSQMNSN
jgi:hypothetical protein